MFSAEAYYFWVFNNVNMRGSSIPSMGGFPVTHIWANSNNRTFTLA